MIPVASVTQTEPLSPPSIEEIVAEIGERYRPSRVVLFGSRARGDAVADSDYDLYVEAASCDTPLDDLHDQILAVLRRRDPRVSLIVDLIVAPKGQIDRRRDDPGTLEWDVAREGLALYANGKSVRSRVAPDVIREPSPRVPQSVEEWIALAEQDRGVARHLLETASVYTAAVCFHAQQTGEKYLKALLVSRRVRPARTHNLIRLLADARRAGFTLDGLERDCEILTKHAVATRYSLESPLTEAAARAAFAAAERVVGAARNLLDIAGTRGG